MTRKVSADCVAPPTALTHPRSYHYATGDGVPVDEKEAVRWFRLAADQRDVFAQYNLAFAYANGRGVPTDQSEAAHWYQLAAEQGMPNPAATWAGSTRTVWA